MKSFIAIDFETANQHRSSICSMGLVIVKNGVIAENYYHLVKPNPHFYCSWATDIHGITKSDTMYEQEFPEVWQSIADKFEDLPFVAHNSAFDESCLKAVFELYGMPYPNYEFFCTYRSAKRAFPELINHKLNTVSSHIGYKLSNHHHALADAEACARIAMQIF